MLEVWQASLSGANIIPTILLGISLIYWIFVIIGALDLEILDIDFGLDADAEIDVDVDVDAGSSIDATSGISFFQTFLVYFNVGYVPVAILLSIHFIFFWAFSVLSYILLKHPNNTISLLLLIPGFLGGLFIMKFMTIPIKRLTIKGNKSAKRKTIGQICKLMQNLEPGRLGQGEVKTEGAPLIVTIKVKGPEPMKKGQTALIIDKDKQNNFFYIEPFNDWEA